MFDVSRSDADTLPGVGKILRGRAPLLMLAAVLTLGVAAGTTFLVTHPNSSTLAGMTWSPASVPQTAGLDHPLRAVTGTGSGFLAGGQDDTGALVWTSGDGRSWQPLAGGPSVGEVDAFATFGGRTYAAGGHGVANDELPTVWSSGDGHRWTALTLPDAGGAVHALAAGPAGLVAAGSEPAGFSSVWHSTDGEQWQLVDLVAQGVLPGHDLAVTSVVATAHGYVGLAGATSALPTVAYVLLTSPDGLHWSRVPGADLPGAMAAQPAAVFPQPAAPIITALAADQDRVLAFAINSDLRWRPRDNATINHIAPAVWASADGRSWSRVDRPAPAAPGEWTEEASWPARVNAAVQAGGVLWAAGTMARGVGQSAMDAAVWASTDRGAHWAALPNTWQGLLSGNKNPSITGLAYAGGTLVAAGAQDNDLTPVAWRAAPPGR